MWQRWSDNCDSCSDRVSNVVSSLMVTVLQSPPSVSSSLSLWLSALLGAEDGPEVKDDGWRRRDARSNLGSGEQRYVNTCLSVCVCVCVGASKLKLKNFKHVNKTSAVAFACEISVVDWKCQRGAQRKQRAGESGSARWLDKSQQARLVSIIIFILLSRLTFLHLLRRKRFCRISQNWTQKPKMTWESLMRGNKKSKNCWQKEKSKTGLRSSAQTENAESRLMLSTPWSTRAPEQVSCSQLREKITGEPSSLWLPENSLLTPDLLMPQTHWDCLGEELRGSGSCYRARLLCCSRLWVQIPLWLLFMLVTHTGASPEHSTACCVAQLAAVVQWCSQLTVIHMVDSSNPDMLCFSLCESQQRER